MATIFTNEQIHSIIDDNYARSPTEYFANMLNKSIKSYTPIFFKPYEHTMEFGSDLVSVAVEPIRFTGIAAAATFAAVLAVTVCAGSLIVSAGATLSLNTSFSDDALNFAGFALSMAGCALVTAVTSLLYMVLNIPHSLVSLLTRSATTVFDLCLNAEPRAQEPEDYQTVLAYYP
ncbi:MAG: hypothetical protein PSV35_07320 [bacterium]|nr:hypothetical protein [bacterium]